MRNVCVLLFLLGALTASAKKRYDGYQLLEVVPNNVDDAKVLKGLEASGMIDLQNDISRKRSPVSIVVSPEHLPRVRVALKKTGMKVTLVNKNIQVILDEQDKRLANHKAFDIDDFNTNDDINSQLQTWASECPGTLTCTVYSIGSSVEGRDINAMRIGTGNPVIAQDTMIHAREWLTAATTLKMIDHILTNHDSDADVVDLLSKYDFVFIPIHNPDGYEYTWTDDRLWRKNRVENDGSRCVGVDLNRNFDVEQFGMQGVSTNPCSDIYCGPNGGSEPETQALQNEALRLQGEGESGVAAWVSYHSYAWMWMFPWGYTEDFGDFSDCVRTDDFDDLYYVSEAVQAAILESSGERWDIGTTCETIYPTTGGTDDWLKAEAGVKYMFSPEMRGPGFIVSPDEIQPSFEECWAGTIAMMNAIEEIEG